jgi:hypothetical protein
VKTLPNYGEGARKLSVDHISTIKN